MVKITNTQTPTHRSFRNHRHGLAPLELVLWLPLLMLLAALIVNYGTMAAWRLRGETVSRDAVWRVRWPRTGSNAPRPDDKVWPADARMTAVVDAPLTAIDDPAIEHPVVRGPLPNGFEVLPALDPDHRGALLGIGEIDRTYPMLPKLGQYHSGEIENSLLDEKWSVAQMGIHSNETRRSFSIYQFPEAPAHLAEAVRSAAQALIEIASDDAFDVMERVIRDYHPRIYANIYSLDPQEVRERKVKPVVDHFGNNGRVVLGQISRIPRQMTEDFLRMFRAERDSGVMGLDTVIEQLEDYLGRMSQIEGQLVDGFLQSAGG